MIYWYIVISDKYAKIDTGNWYNGAKYRKCIRKGQRIGENSQIISIGDDKGCDFTTQYCWNTIKFYGFESQRPKMLHICSFWNRATQPARSARHRDWGNRPDAGRGQNYTKTLTKILTYTSPAYILISGNCFPILVCACEFSSIWVFLPVNPRIMSGFWVQIGVVVCKILCMYDYRSYLTLLW